MYGRARPSRLTQYQPCSCGTMHANHEDLTKRNMRNTENGQEKLLDY